MLAWSPFVSSHARRSPARFLASSMSIISERCLRRRPTSVAPAAACSGPSSFHAAASGFISPRPLNRCTFDLCRVSSRPRSVEDAFALGFVERIENLLADVDAVQRRHRDVDVTGHRPAGGSAARTARTAAWRCARRRNRRRRGCRSCRSAARRDRRAGIDTDGNGDVVHFLRREHFGRVDFPGVEDLAAQRHDRLELAVARLLRRAAGRIAFDQEQLGAAAVLRRRSRRACPAAPDRP